MKYKTKFTTEDVNSYYFVRDNMILGHDHSSNKYGNNGIGDALWRTGWAYTAYGNKKLKEGILSCFTDEEDKKGKYIQAHRCYPRYRTDDVSRDQIISALCSLKLNGQDKEVKRLRKGLRWKISKKFTMTVDMWLWLMAISTPQPLSFIFSLIFTIIHFFITAPLVLWNSLLNRWAKMKEISQEKYNENLKSGMKVTNTKDMEKPSKIRKLKYPSYALHLFAWQLYSLPWNPLKWLLKLACRPSVHKSNYLMKMLFGAKVLFNDIEEYRPMCGLRWQVRFFEGEENGEKICFYNNCEIIEENNYFHNEHKITTEYNSIDNDLLYYLKDKHPNLIKYI